MTDIHGIEAVASLTDSERAEVFSETSTQTGLVAAAVEKDYWVCWALYRLFNDQILSSRLSFKGGTTLSKCYGLIERFSEDIDLILDWTLLTDENPYQERSNRQQDIFNREMERSACEYIGDVMLPAMNTLMGDHCQFRIDESKPRSIFMVYAKAFKSEYIKPEIELEFSPMSAMTPSDIFTIKPYCSDAVVELVGIMDVSVKAIQAKKTFWDKVTILHVEAHRPENKNQPPRYSRHYYDLFQMIRSPVVEEALEDLALLNEIVGFKEKFYPQGWANYESARNGVFKLIPENFRITILQRDYEQLEEMIFGTYPSFNLVLDEIRLFETRLNNTYET